jgi:hypothetical protein
MQSAISNQQIQNVFVFISLLQKKSNYTHSIRASQKKKKRKVYGINNNNNNFCVYEGDIIITIKSGVNIITNKFCLFVFYNDSLFVTKKRRS